MNKRVNTTQQGALAVATSSVAVMAQNYNRSVFLIQNNGTGDVWLSFTATAVAGQGYLLAIGATLGLDTVGMAASPVSAICSAGSTTLFVLEG